MNYKTGLLLSAMLLSSDFIFSGLTLSRYIIKKENNELENKHFSDAFNFVNLPDDIKERILEYILISSDDYNISISDKKKRTYIYIKLKDMQIDDLQKILDLRLINKNLKASIDLDKYKLGLDYIKKIIKERKRKRNLLFIGESSIYGVKNLIKFGSDNINIQNDIRQTPLITAAVKDYNKYLIQYLIKLGADLDIQDSKGWTALMHAAFNDNVILVKILIGSGANSKLKGLNCEIALDLAKDEEIIKILKNYNNLKFEFFEKLSLKLKKEIFSHLLIFAIESFSINEKIEFFRLRQVNKEFKSIIDSAFLSKNGLGFLKEGIEVKKEILGQKLIKAIKNNDVKSVKRLIDEGASFKVVDEIKEAPVFLSCSLGNSKVLELLLDAGADPDLHDHFSTETPLMLVSSTGHKEKAKALLNAGANVNKQNLLGKTPLMHACKNGNKDIIKVLTIWGMDNIDFNRQDINGNTALICASEKGYADIVKLLIKRSRLASYFNKNKLPIDINAQNTYGSTALIFACKEGHKDIVQLLIDFGANVDLKDSVSKTALDHAVNDEIKEIIQKAMNQESKKESSDCEIKS